MERPRGVLWPPSMEEREGGFQRRGFRDARTIRTALSALGSEGRPILDFLVRSGAFVRGLA